MKVLKKFSVAVIITAIVVVMGVMYSLAAAPAAMVDVTVGNWVQDDADVLSEETEQEIRRWNNQWGSTYDAYVAVATVNSMSGWDEDEYCLTMADNWGLIESDMLLVLDIGQEIPYFYEGGAYPDLDLNYYINTYLTDDFLAGRYDEAVMSLMGALNGYFASVYDSSTEPTYEEDWQEWNEEENWDNGADWNEEAYSTNVTRRIPVIGIIVLIIVVIAILQAIDRSRYRRWYGMYGTMATPPVMFRPILFWNRGGFGPRPPMGGPGPRPPMGGPGPGPRPPVGGPGPRPPMGGPGPGSRPPTGGGSAPRPPMGGGSAPRPPMGGASRGGSFGGGRSSGGGSFGGRGGSFGGRK